MAFNQSTHIEHNVEERVDRAWEYTPTHRLRGQDYVVMSVVAPSGTNQTCPDVAIKIFGCFPTEDAANAYAKELSSECNVFDIYVATTLDWLKLPPEVARIDDVHFQEQSLLNLKQKIIDTRKAKAQLMEDRMNEDKQFRKQQQDRVVA